MISKKGQIEGGIIILMIIFTAIIFLVSSGIILNPLKEHNYIIKFEPKQNSISRYSNINFDFQITNPKKEIATLYVNLSYDSNVWVINDYDKKDGFIFEDLLQNKIKDESITLSSKSGAYLSEKNYTFTLDVFDNNGQILDSMEQIISVN